MKLRVLPYTAPFLSVCIYKLRAKSGILNVDKGGAGIFQDWMDRAEQYDEKKRAEGYTVVNIEDKYTILKLVTVPIDVAAGLLVRIINRLFPRFFSD